MDKFVAHGYLDTFRIFTQEPGHYSYWDIKTAARGAQCRLAYRLLLRQRRSAHRVKAAFIMPEVRGSDHCPVGIELTA